MTDLTEKSGAATDPLADFDAEWYLRTYPDVGQSDLTPQAHFLKFGIAMGRAPNAGARPAALRPGPGPQAGDLPAQGASVLSYGTEIGRFRDLSALQKALAPILTYRRMMAGLATADPSFVLRHAGQDRALDLALLAPDTRAATDDAFLRAGALRLENLAFVGSNQLRVSVTGRDMDPAMDQTAPAPEDQPDCLRIWQASPASPDALRPVGRLTLPEAGPAFLDARLIHPLMPLLLEAADSDGFTRAWALLPFPSLCAGGMHAAERAAAQLGWSPMDEIWRLSRAYLDEMLASGAPFALGQIRARLAGATGAEALLSRPVRDWLGAVFGLGVMPETEPDPAQDHLTDMLGDGAGRDGRLTLHLPAEMVPTIAALVSRRLDLPAECPAASGPFLVAEAISHRPLWSVSWPMDAVRFGTAEDQPRLSRTGRAPDTVSDTVSGKPAPYSWLAPLHLGIALRPPRPVEDILQLVPLAPDMSHTDPAQARPDLSLVLSVRDAPLTARFLAALAGQEGVRIADILLRPETADPATRDEILTLAQALFPGQSRWLEGAETMSAALDAALDQGEGGQILIADAAVLLYAPDTLAGLQDLLACDPQAGSISCALLHEAVFKKQARLQVASAGIFPAQVSFATAPRLGVTEPDAPDALPRATYPVIANGFGLCLIRPDAIEATRAARAQPFGAVADLQFGLDAFAAGWRSLCTTAIRAGTTRAPSRRDEIDPLGLACLLPARWDDLLSRVTVLRELRG